jgi:hypothetical protein
MEPVRREARMLDAAEPEEIRASPLEEADIAAMIDKAGEVGVLVIDAYPKDVPLRRLPPAE